MKMVALLNYLNIYSLKNMDNFYSFNVAEDFLIKNLPLSESLYLYDNAYLQILFLLYNHKSG